MPKKLPLREQLILDQKTLVAGSLALGRDRPFIADELVEISLRMKQMVAELERYRMMPAFDEADRFRL